MMVKVLKRMGHVVNRKRVQRLMNLMGIRSLAPQKKTTIPHPDHFKYPYLLRGLNIDHPNHVWCADITYVPFKKGFLYLVAVMDWHSRKVLSWRLSNTMTPDFCVAALEEALALYGTPEIFNTDQGSQFTATAFTKVLSDAKVTISMDGVGTSDRQRLHRTTLAHDQVRPYLPQPSRQRQRPARRTREVHRLLQRGPAPQRTG